MSAARRVAVAGLSVVVSVPAGVVLTLSGGVPGALAASVLVPAAAVAAAVWLARSADGSRWSVRAEAGVDAEGLSVVVCGSCGLSGPMGHTSPDASALAELHDRMHHGSEPTAVSGAAVVVSAPAGGWL